LKDKLLIQVCFGQFQVQFHFQEDTHISVESAFEIETANGVFERYVVGSGAGGRDIVQFADKLTKFLGSTVKHVEWLSDGTLTIIFLERGKLKILDDDPRHEAYQVQHGTDLFVI
jgi:hypothetical protein